MRMTRKALMLVLALALAAPVLAVPATALAQSAGDDQYVDPFESQPDDQNNNGSGDQGGQSQTTTPDTGTAPAQSTAPTATEAQSGDTLPRTGLPLVGLGLSGAFLLSGGFALRRRT
jgi:hypothetical protein